jgi:uncharacterized membrane protein YccC
VGRKLNVVGAAIALSIFAADPSFGQGPPPPYNQQIRRPHGVRDRWSQLPPDERQTFQRNAERWLRMTPQQQNVLRQREKLRRARLKTEADRALHQSGLQLDPSARDSFEARYSQERRRMERALRKELETRRQQELPALGERLKSEFQRPRSPNGRSTSTPAVSTRPRP